MNSIKNYISDLLYLYDCVIIPGFGGFIANERTTLFGEKNCILYPPSREIGFNRALLYNDGLLAKFISQKESVSYKFAVEKIKSFVKEVNLELLSGKETSFGKLGTIKQDITNNLIFTPNEDSHFLLDSYGLTSFRFAQLKDKNVTSRIKFSKYDSNPLHSARNFSIRNLAAATIIVVFFLFTTNLNEPHINQAGISSTIIDLKEVSKEIKIEIEENKDLIKEQIEIAPIKTNLDDDLPEIKNNTSKKYHLIVSSFPNYKLATKDLELYKLEGYTDAKIIDNGSGHIRVSLYSYYEKEEAILAVENLRKQTKFSAAWVFKF